ncbi:MAG: hypothetical protein IIB62_00570 [Proteobacteria bacterium]|nr:hypothetical protein [Pseudomonadota bacterium]
MAKTQVKKAPTSAAEREAPVIKPKNVSIQSAGYLYKTVVVMLPDGLTAQDINDSPEIWRLVQVNSSGVALAEHDKLELRSRDWTIFAAVNHASATEVVLYDIRKASKPRREVALFSDANYEVKWASGGYGYYRKRDGLKMSVSTWSTPEAAKAALLREQYPARVA